MLEWDEHLGQGKPGYIPWITIYEPENQGKMLAAQSCLTLCDPMARLFSPWNSPGKNTGVGNHSLLQGIFSTQESNLCLLHCRQTLYHLSHQGSPIYDPSNFPTLSDPVSPKLFGNMWIILVTWECCRKNERKRYAKHCFKVASFLVCQIGLRGHKLEGWWDTYFLQSWIFFFLENIFVIQDLPRSTWFSSI